MIENGQRYIDLAIFGVNVFNYCNLDYYLISIGNLLIHIAGLTLAALSGTLIHEELESSLKLDVFFFTLASTTSGDRRLPMTVVRALARQLILQLLVAFAVRTLRMVMDVARLSSTSWSKELAGRPHAVLPPGRP